MNNVFLQPLCNLQGYLAVSDLPLVSMDFKKSDVSTTIDSSLTMVMGDDMVKVSQHSTPDDVLAVCVSWVTRICMPSIIAAVHLRWQLLCTCVKFVAV